MLYWFHMLSYIEWALLCALIPLYFGIHAKLLSVARNEFREYRAFAKGLAWSQWVFALLVSVAWILIHLYLIPRDSVPLLSEIMLEQQKVLLSSEQSVLAQIIDRYTTYYAAVMDMGLHILKVSSGRLYFVMALLVTFAALASFANALSAFLIPAKEYRRIAVPLAEKLEVPTVGFEKSSALGAMCAVGLCFIYPALAIYVDTLVASKVSARDFAQFELAIKPQVEKFENRYYKAGTRDSLHALAIDTLARQQQGMELLEKQMDEAYRVMEGNVDAYLDAYYSLPAEYMRLAALLSNSLESRISADLTRTLNSGEPFARFEKSLRAVSEQNHILEASFREASLKLLKDNEVSMPEGDFWVIDEYSQESILRPSAEIERINGNMRGAVAGLGAISAMVATKVVSKAAAKGTLRLAAKAVAKAAASKVGAGGAATAAGAAIGSIIPGAGTFAGAVIGAGVGLIVGVSIDATLLQVEEMISREDFRRQIIDSIRQAKAEHKKQLGFDVSG
ncbi:hypothetical protein SAMN05216562_0798 [Microbulbifer marinus]|uniref:Uncharacterized protein n=2 Tax=Microbulbifer marinus TaxID=658218 RepID=A0A1H3WGV0_9GAMM|nr:hypothetical protein SAMN05216562_0798 [Microbulbifer marinus]